MEKRHGSPTTAGLGLLQNTRTGDPWAGQPKYSKGITATISIIILICAIASLHSRWQRLGPRLHRGASDVISEKRTLRPSKLARPIAALRMLAYRRLPSFRLGFVNFRLPVLGATLALGAFTLGFTIWAFVVQPYYRVDRSFGSPPLALRSGMMALGLMPFIYVLGSKVNFISLLTGVSHEKLQVYHQWLARFMLFLATIHVIPFIHQPLADHGVAGLRAEFFSDSINTTGVVAYACLFVLSFASLTGIREKCYELFLLIHVPVAILFLAYMFIHCQALLTSWRYLWGTAALYMLSVFLRFANQLRQNSFLSLSKCRIEALPGGLTKMTVQSTLRWKPGQHAFVRFPGLAPLSAHPFTIISMPSPDDHQLVSTVVLVAKARTGFTKNLYERARKAQTSHSEDGIAYSAILDGPYGQNASIARYQRVLLLAGGSGITFVLASLVELSWLWQQNRAATQQVHLVWSMRAVQMLDWVQKHLVTIAALAPPDALKVSLYISGRDVQVEDLDLPSSWDLHWGTHPDAASAVRDMASVATCGVVRKEIDVDVEQASSSAAHARMQQDEAPAPAVVVVCGPSGMVLDASDAVSSLQADIVRGKMSGLCDISLLTESFGF